MARHKKKENPVDVLVWLLLKLIGGGLMLWLCIKFLNSIVSKVPETSTSQIVEHP